MNNKGPVIVTGPFVLAGDSRCIDSFNALFLLGMALKGICLYPHIYPKPRDPLSI